MRSLLISAAFTFPLLLLTACGSSDAEDEPQQQASAPVAAEDDNDAALPMLAIAASALWSGQTAKSQWQPFTVAHGLVKKGSLQGIHMRC
ncbi:hypothetical protein [Qipengyuania sp. SM2507]